MGLHKIPFYYAGPALHINTAAYHSLPVYYLASTKRTYFLEKLNKYQTIQTMKKVVLSLAAMMSICLAANAQVSLIPKAGVTVTNMAYKDKEEGQKSKVGAVVGLGLNLPVSEIFSVQPELLYIQKGYSIDLEETIMGRKFSEKSKTGMNHIEMPVLAKASFGSEAVKAYINAGPSVGFALGGHYSYQSTGMFNMESSGKIRFGEGEDDETLYLDTEDYNRIDVGMQFGGGVALKAGPGSLLLDARYGLGLSNFWKTPEGESSEDYKSRNRVFAISVGYAIPFGGK
jgi:hypothetical protein